MKKFRSSIAVILSVLMLLSVIAVSSYAVSAETTASSGKVVVNTKSNNVELAGKLEADTTKAETIIVKYNLKSVNNIIGCQGILNYDSNVLELVSFEMPNVSNTVINTGITNMVKFNASNCQDTFDFKTSKEFCVVTFNVKSDCDTTVALDFEELNANNGTDIPLVTLGEVVGSYTISSDVAIKTAETESTDTSSSETESSKVTEETKAPSVKLVKNRIKAGEVTKIKVSNAGKNKITYKVSKKNVVKVTNKGVVTGLTSGKTTIIVNVGKKVFKKDIKVTSSPTIKNGKKILKNKAKIVIKKGNKVTLKITGKAASIKNNVKVAKSKFAKVTSKPTQSKVILKGVKKGNTTVTVKINGVKTYKYNIKVK